MLEWLGEKERPVRVAPTEVVHLEARKLYEDFNFEMKNGWWYHFEFESDQVTLDDLKRFREYEASTSRIFGVTVVTCVICSARAVKILDEFTEGLNSYRVKIIRMKDENADDIFDAIQRKENVERRDLIPILLSPLMVGKMRVKDRILNGIRLVQREEKCLKNDEANKMQAVLYAFANKFLRNDELKEIEEAIIMTRLGQMLLERGMEQGIERGIKALIENCMEFGLSRKETSEKIKSKFDLNDIAAEEHLQRYWK